MSEYKFYNGFIYRKDFKLPMTRVVEFLNEMSAKLHEKDREYKDLFEAFEDGQKVLEDANKRVAELEERCHPSKVIMIGERGHYVSPAVFDEITQLRKEQDGEV